jgi:hypothetical protein
LSVELVDGSKVSTFDWVKFMRGFTFLDGSMDLA